MRERLERPGYNPEKDMFLAESGGNFIGYINMQPESILRRVILSCWIQPEHRRKGLAGELHIHALKRAGEMGNSVLHVNISDKNDVAVNVLKKLGFTEVRRFLDIQLDMENVRWQEIDPEKLDCRRLLPGEEEKLAVIQNRAFAEHWGYNPNTTESIKYELNRGENSLENIIVTCEGENLTGYCWVQPPRSVNTGERKRGMIYMIGTDPARRGTGAGKRVLLAALLHLKNRGAEVTGRTVDSENTVALALYESVGFEHQSTSLWYEKVIE
jgi:mycothiol synthase